MEENQIITIKPENSSLSGHELVIIPRDPKFSPNDKQLNECLNYLKKEYPENIIQSDKSNQVGFVDCEQNFETVQCNWCREEMETEFWQEQL